MKGIPRRPLRNRLTIGFTPVFQPLSRRNDNLIKVASDTNPRERLVGRFTEDNVPEKLGINNFSISYGVSGGEVVIDSPKPIRTDFLAPFSLNGYFRFQFQRDLLSLGKGYAVGDVLEFCADQSDEPLRVAVSALRPTNIVSFADDSSGWEPGDIFSNQDRSAWFEVRSVDSNGKILDMKITLGVATYQSSYYRSELSSIFTFSQVPPQNRITDFNPIFFNDSSWDSDFYFSFSITEKNVVNHPRTFPSFIECDFGVANATALQEGRYRRLKFQEHVEQLFETEALPDGSFGINYKGGSRRSLNWSGGSGTGFSVSAWFSGIHILSNGISGVGSGFSGPHLVGKFAYPNLHIIFSAAYSSPNFYTPKTLVPRPLVAGQRFIVETLETQTIKEPSSGQAVLVKFAENFNQPNTLTAISAEGSKFIVQTPDGNKKISIKNQRSFSQGYLIGRRFNTFTPGPLDRELLQKLTDAIPGIDVERTSQLKIL
jgi:hypothetical protein